MSPEIWLTDMSRCLPEKALSTGRRKSHWQLLEYEAAGGIKGVMLSAGPETAAPDVTYPLDFSGWHTIRLGVWGGGSTWDYMIKVRLEGDPFFSTFIREKPHPCTMEEVLWKHADLTGQQLIVRQQRPNPNGTSASASLAYVRLTPMSAEEVGQLQSDRAREDTKRLIMHAEPGSGVWEQEIMLEEDVEPFRNTDFKKLFWEVAYGDTIIFGDRLGRSPAQNIEDYPSAESRWAAQSLKALADEGLDPLKTAVEYTHSMGLELHVGQRVEAFAGPPPSEEFTTEFYHEHPEFRMVDKDGLEIDGLSYAYPEVRSHYISVLRDAAEYGADGAFVIFIRGTPILLYEQPLVDGFREAHGVDPRYLDEKDETWLRYRAGFVTQLMVELRQAMDEVGEKLGKRLETAAITLATEADNLICGLDVETWVRRGLVDTLLPYPSYAGRLHAVHMKKEIDMAYYAGITRGSKCKLCPTMFACDTLYGKNLFGSGQSSVGRFRSKALTYYEAGADGIHLWEGGHATRSAMWSSLKRLGHVDELKAWAEEKKRKREPRTVNLTRLGGHTMDRYSPHRGE